MSSFKIANIGGEYEHEGPIEVKVVGDEKSGFWVTLIHQAGAMRYQFHLNPDQSARLREALEEAESKAEILTAAI